MSKKTMQVFTIAFCLVLSMLALFFSYRSQNNRDTAHDVAGITFVNAAAVESALTQEAYKRLPELTEHYFKSIGYKDIKRYITPLEVLEAGLEEKTDQTTFRCYYEPTKTNTLVITYIRRTDSFEFMIEEQKE